MRTHLTGTPRIRFDTHEPRTAAKAQRIGVYGGSFDPLTIGHLWMIEQGVRLFDRLVVAIGVNPDKQCTFPVAERLAMLRESTRQFQNLTVSSFSNLYLIRYAESIGATHILRGVRSAADYEYERTMRNINGDLHSGICTLFLMPPRPIAEVSSSMVKGLVGPADWPQIVRHYVPKPVYRRLLERHATTCLAEALPGPEPKDAGILAPLVCAPAAQSQVGA